MASRIPISPLGSRRHSQPIVAQQAWQERLNKLFQPAPVPSNVPLEAPSKRQTTEGFTVDDSADVASKPTTERIFTDEIIFGYKSRVKLPPSAAYNISPVPKAEPQPTGTSSKATVQFPMGDEIASCTIEVPTTEFAGVEEDEAIARMRKRIADLSAQIISTIAMAAGDAEQERPKKRRRLNSDLAAIEDEPAIQEQPTAREQPMTGEQLMIQDKPTVTPNTSNSSEYVALQVRRPLSEHAPAYFELRRTISLEKLRLSIIERFDIKCGARLSLLYNGKHIHYGDTAEKLNISNGDIIEAHVLCYGPYRNAETDNEED